MCRPQYGACAELSLVLTGVEVAVLILEKGLVLALKVLNKSWQSLILRIAHHEFVTDLVATGAWRCRAL